MRLMMMNTLIFPVLMINTINGCYDNIFVKSFIKFLVR